MAEGELPFRTEYAKSNRSACKLCKNNINKDSLRMAKMVQVSNFLILLFSPFFTHSQQSPHFDGKVILHYNTCNDMLMVHFI